VIPTLDLTGLASKVFLWVPRARYVGGRRDFAAAGSPESCARSLVSISGRRACPAPAHGMAGIKKETKPGKETDTAAWASVRAVVVRTRGLPGRPPGETGGERRGGGNRR